MLEIPSATTLASYLPVLRRQKILERSEALRHPTLTRTSGALLFMDVSGFTRLSESLAQRGKMGAEDLSEILNAYFGRLVDVLTDHGGDILIFAGDSVLALWPAQGKDLRPAVRSACQSALKIQERLTDFEPAPGIRLRLRASIGAGRLACMEIGGVRNIWHFLVAGEAIEQTVRTDAEAGRIDGRTAGKVLLSRAAFQEIEGEIRSVEIGDHAVQCRGFLQPTESEAAAVPVMPQELSTALRDCVPPILWDRLAAGQESWLAEFRMVTVFFLQFPPFDFESERVIETVQEAVEIVQQQLLRSGGSVYQLLMDDKGTTLIAAFGMPPRAHPDDAERAVRTALEIHRELGERGLVVSIGINTGTVFCGVYGTEKRRQYSLVGTPINLAARLMQAASGKILLSTATRDSVRREDLDFIPGPDLQVKGVAGPTAVYEPRLTIPKSSPKIRRTLCGREEELRNLSVAFSRLIEHGEGETLLLIGRAGIGKSILASHFLEHAETSGATCLIGVADSIEQATPYVAWRGVLRKILHLEEMSDALQAQASQAQTSQLQAHIHAHLPPDLHERAPLLNPVLPHPLPETRLTSSLSGEVRAENTRSLLWTLLDQFCRTTPVVLLLEDIHWLDPASLALAQLLARSRTRLVTLLTFRESDKTDEVPEFEGARCLPLGPLTHRQASRLIRTTLGLETVDQTLAELIFAQAKGHPFFTEELAFTLHRTDLFAKTLGLSPREIEEKVRHHDLPNSIQAAIISRLDTLSQEHQLVVKIASVMGRTFEVSMLGDIHHLTGARGNLKKILADLIDADILDPEPSGEAYTFRQGMIREVVYDSILFAQRRDLHQKVAQWYEQTFADSLESHYPILAHHWCRAEVNEKALEFLDKAGKQALDGYNNEAAVAFLTEAVELSGKDETIPTEVLALRHLRLGRAFVGWSKYTQGCEHLVRGLTLLGYPSWTGDFQAGLDLLRQLLVQVGHRLRGIRSISADDPKSALIPETALAYDSLMEAYFMSGKDLFCLAAILRSLNLAEKSESSAVLARGYASFGCILFTTGLEGSAENYCRRALAVADAITDESARSRASIAIGVGRIGLGLAHQKRMAREMFEQAAEISERIQDGRGWDDSMQNLSFLSLLEGNLETCLQQSEALFESSRFRGDLSCQAEAARRRALCFFLQGRLDEFTTAVEELQGLREKSSGFQVPDGIVLEALLHLHHGEKQEAFQKAEEARRLYAKMQQFYDTFMERTLLLDIYLELLQEEQTQGKQPSQAELKTGADQALADLLRHAKIFPIARVAAGLQKGRMEALREAAGRAQKTWLDARRAAQDLQMPYFEARILLAVGRHSSAHAQQSEEYLATAAEIFQRIGIPFDGSNSTAG